MLYITSLHLLPNLYKSGITPLIRGVRAGLADKLCISQLILLPNPPLQLLIFRNFLQVNNKYLFLSLLLNWQKLKNSKKVTYITISELKLGWIQS